MACVGVVCVRFVVLVLCCFCLVLLCLCSPFEIILFVCCWCGLFDWVLLYFGVVCGSYLFVVDGCVLVYCVS